MNSTGLSQTTDPNLAPHYTAKRYQRIVKDPQEQVLGGLLEIRHDFAIRQFCGGLFVVGICEDSAKNAHRQDVGGLVLDPWCKKQNLGEEKVRVTF